MGTRGPKRTPTKILKMRGSWRANAREGEPIPASKAPPCPQWLKEKAERAVWRTLVNRLMALHLIGEIDQHALGRYVRLFLLWRKMDDFVKGYDESYPIMAPDRAKPLGFKLFPQTVLALDLSDKLLRLEQHFGMTPSARAALAGAVQRPVEEPEPRGKARFFEAG
jgi:P27 family predicted phage terminase small subunit